DVLIALGNGDDVAPLALPRGDVEETADAAVAGVFKHFALAFDQSFVVEVAVTVDQRHFAASWVASSSSSSSRGKSGTGCEIGAPPSPASMRFNSLPADSGMIGEIDSARCRSAVTSVPSTAAIRSGSVLRSAHGAWVSTYWLHVNTARSQASMPWEKARRSKASGTSFWVAFVTAVKSSRSSAVSPGAGRIPPKFL